jgi:hypothetical protein
MGSRLSVDERPGFHKAQRGTTPTKDDRLLERGELGLLSPASLSARAPSKANFAEFTYQVLR